MDKKRSIGVTVFGVFIIIISVMTLMMCLQFFISGTQESFKKVIEKQTAEIAKFKEKELEKILAITTKHMRNTTVSITVYATIGLISGIGIIRRKNWCRLLFMLMIGIGFLSNILGIILHHSLYETTEFLELIPNFSISIFVTFISLFYFTRPKVKEQFKR